MGLSIGIVGLPNVGKSTLFNALTKAQNASSANYPFCTIEPNKAIVPVPDSRLERLSEIVKPRKSTPAVVEFIDIAGLVKGASQGEGLGNQFLANIREVDAIVHVLRCFEDDDIAHVHGEVDPIQDMEIIETELILADLQNMERKAEKLQKQTKSGDKKVQALLKEVQKLITHLGQGKPASTFEGKNTELMTAVYKEHGLLTSKEMILCANVQEHQVNTPPELVEKLYRHADRRGLPVITISAKMEEELAELEDEEREEFLSSYAISESGIDQVIRTGYDILGLTSFFTAGPKEVRAWTVKKGSKAPQAAGAIHSDFQRGFIRAEVIKFEDYMRMGSELKCKEKGLMSVQGKDYQVCDGDVIHFLFNV